MRYFIAIVLFSLMLSSISLLNAQEPVKGPSLEAAALTIDITPSYPVALYGYANQPLSTAIRDPLKARITLFRLGKEELVLISTDLLCFGSTADHIAELMCRKLRIERRQLVLAANHNHSGPSLIWNTMPLAEETETPNERYTRKLAESLTEAVITARKAYVPISLLYAKGASPVGVNRRAFWPKGDAWPSGRSYIKILQNPSGIRDPEVLLAVAMAEGGAPIASLWSFACHNRSFRSDRTKISGDLFGFAARMVEDRLGIPSASFAGASGDIDPWFTGGPKLKTEDEYAKMETAGAMLGWEILGLAETVRKYSNFRLPEMTHILGSRQFDLVLPIKGSTSADMRTAEVTVWSRLTVAVVDELLIVVSDAELSTEIGLAIKEGSPFEHVLMVTNANGGRGYLPATRQYAEGGYEVDASIFGVGSAELLVDAVLNHAWDYRRASGKKPVTR